MVVCPAGKTIEDFEPEIIPDYSDADFYRQDVSQGDVSAFLARVKECIRADRFVVEDGSIVEGDGGVRKNSAFMNVYGLYRRSDQKQLLLSITLEDFCHVRKANDGRELYVFCVQRPLYRAGSGTCSVWVYVKQECEEGREPFDVVVSLHELELPIELPFAME